MKNAFLVLFAFISLAGYSQDTLLIKEIFDFEIGDIFHYLNDHRDISGTGSVFEVDTLIDKSYSSNLDTVFYKFSEYTLNNQLFNRKIRIDKYFNLDSLLWYYDYIIKTTVNLPNNISGKDGCGSILRGYAVQLSMYETYGNTYGVGLGIVTSFDTWPHSYITKSLTYYKKNNLICSNGQVMDIFKLNISKDEVKIYPNPASDYIEVELPSSNLIYSLKIFDLMGRNVLNLEKCIGGNLNLNIGHLSFGIYELMIQTKEGEVFYEKFIKQ
jgi:hypothetical protein